MCNKNATPRNREVRTGEHRRARSAGKTVHHAKPMSERGTTKDKVPPVSSSNRKK